MNVEDAVEADRPCNLDQVSSVFAFAQAVEVGEVRRGRCVTTFKHNTSWKPYQCM
jgi:hypothetical protein